MSSTDAKATATEVVESEISTLQKDLLDLINVDESGVDSSAADVDDDESFDGDNEINVTKQIAIHKDDGQAQQGSVKSAASQHARNSTAESLRGFHDATGDSTSAVSVAFDLVNATCRIYSKLAHFPKQKKRAENGGTESPLSTTTRGAKDGDVPSLDDLAMRGGTPKIVQVQTPGSEAPSSVGAGTVLGQHAHFAMKRRILELEQENKRLLRKLHEAKSLR